MSRAVRPWKARFAQSSGEPAFAPPAASGTTDDRRGPRTGRSPPPRIDVFLLFRSLEAGAGILAVGLALVAAAAYGRGRP